MSSHSIFHAIAQMSRAIPVNNTGTGVTIVNIDELHQVSLNAGIEWSNELRRLLGKDAGKARYDERGVSTPRLRQLHDAHRAAQSAFLEAIAAAKEVLPRSTVKQQTNREPSPGALRKVA